MDRSPSRPARSFDTAITRQSEPTNQPDRKDATTHRLLDIDGAAEYLNVSPRFIRRITYLKIGKFVRFDQVDLDDWIQQQRVDALPPV